MGFKRKSKHKLDKESKKKRKKKKKKPIWQTIVFAHSPTEDSSMLFEEGPSSAVPPPVNGMSAGDRILRSGVGTRDASAKRARKKNEKGASKGNKPQQVVIKASSSSSSLSKKEE